MSAPAGQLGRPAPGTQEARVEDRDAGRQAERRAALEARSEASAWELM